MRWLLNVDDLNKGLEDLRSRVQSIRRIKVAILDTGLDDSARIFDFYNEPKWIDFVDDSPSCKDSNGHGTHLVSLLMRTAPEAEIYVARVARDTKTLGSAIDNIAKV